MRFRAYKLQIQKILVKEVSDFSNLFVKKKKDCYNRHGKNSEQHKSVVNISFVFAKNLFRTHSIMSFLIH